MRMTRPWNSLWGKTAYRLTQTLRGEPVFRALKELEASQGWPQERLLTLQWQRLKSLLAHAYTIPFYRTSFEAVGLTPSKIHTPADFARFPLLTKKDIRHQAQAMRVVAHGGRASILATSGSSGDPLSVWRSRESTAYARAAMYRAHRWHGLDIGDREVRLWGEPLHWKGKLLEKIKDRLMNRSRVNVYDLRPERMRAFYGAIQRRKPLYVFGYGSMLDYFARFAIAERLDLASFHLRCVKSTSEPLRPDQSARIERLFGCSVLNEYGCTETGVIAATCPQGQMHLSSETVYMELIPLVDSTGYRVVVTDLHNKAMPIIRYDVGDLAQPAAAGGCPCGVGLPLLGEIIGRKSELIEVPGGKKIHSLLLYYILCGLEERGARLRQARLIQRSPDEFVCQIVPDGRNSAGVENLIHQDLARHLGGARIHVESVPEIPPMPNGKHADFVKAF